MMPFVKVLDAFKNRPKSSDRSTSAHNKRCSRYMALTRVQTGENLNLLERVTLEDVNTKPDKLLLLEEQRLADLARKTDYIVRLEENRM
jgi:hypothetical protein